jgi:hypothetical protein
MTKSKQKAKQRRKKKAAIIAAKHIVVHAPLKIHLPHEFIAKPIDWQTVSRTPEMKPDIYSGIAPVPAPKVEVVAERIDERIAPPWWKFWA